LRSPIRFRLGVLVAAAMTVLCAAPVASAAGTPPGEGSRYDQRHDHVGPDHASSVENVSCVGPHGEVYHRHRAATADDKGQNTATTASGDPAACGHRTGNDSRRVILGGGENPLLNISTGDITVLSPGHDNR